MICTCGHGHSWHKRLPGSDTACRGRTNPIYLPGRIPALISDQPCDCPRLHWRRPVNRRCTCGDTRYSHRHDRPGSDCSACTCDRWHWRWTHLAGRLGWRRYRRLVASGERELHVTASRIEEGS